MSSRLRMRQSLRSGAGSGSRQWDGHPKLRGSMVSPQPIQLHWVRLSPAKLRLLSLAAIVVVLLFPAARAQSAEKPSPDQFLIASGIHFNPMADPSLIADLMAAAPAQWEAILQRSKLTAFSQYGHDTNWWLLQSSLNEMRATLPRPAFIMITGDILAHQFFQVIDSS